MDPDCPTDIPLAMSVPLNVYFENIFNQLTVEQVWDMRRVCKWYKEICMEYFKDRLHELVLNDNAFLGSTFGRTRSILATCERLQKFTIELVSHKNGKLFPSKVGDKVELLLSLLAKSRCSLKMFVLRNIPLSNGFPCLARNLQTVQELVIDHVDCIKWGGVLKNVIDLDTLHNSLHSLTLNLEKYDGADLPQMADICPNLGILNVSYLSWH